MVKNTGAALFRQQFKAMIYKRIIYTWRNKLLTLSQIILPLIFTAFTILIIETRPVNEGVADKRALNMTMFDSTEVRNAISVLYMYMMCVHFTIFIL